MNDDIDDYRKRMQERFVQQQSSKNESGIFGALFPGKEQPHGGAGRHPGETDHELAARLQDEYDKEDREATPGGKNMPQSTIDFRTIPLSSSVEMNNLRGGRTENSNNHYSTVATQNPRVIQSQRVTESQGGNFFQVWKNKIFEELDPVGKISFICLLVMLGLILLLILASL